MDSKEASSHAPSETNSGSSFTSETANSSKNTITVNDFGNDNSRNDGKGGVSDDEGYLSGKEEFETTSDKRGLGANEGGGVLEENSDAPFGDSVPEVEGFPVSGVVNDDDAERENKDVGGAGNALEKDSGGGSAADDSKEVKLSGAVESNSGKLVAEEVETKGENSEENPKIGSLESRDEVSEPKAKEFAEAAVVEPKESDPVHTGDVVLSPKGDSVAETSQIENGAVANKSKVKEVAEAAVAEPDRIELVRPTGTPEGDCIVDGIQVDVAGPGVAVVGETEENGGNKIEVPDEKVSSTQVVGVDDQSSEPALENKGDVLEAKSLESESHVVGDEKDKKLDVGAVVGLVNGVNTDEDGTLAVGNNVKKPDVESDPTSALDPQELTKLEAKVDEEVDPEYSMSEGETDGMIFGSSEAAKKFIEELEQGSSKDSHAGADSPFEQPQRIDGQIVTDSEEDGDADDDGDGKELFDSAALAALLKAATGADSDGSNITITSRDGSRLFSVERPAGLGSSIRALRPAPQPNRPNLFSPSTVTSGGESEDNLTEEEKKKLEKLQKIRVKFLRLVHRLGLSPEESVAAQVLYRLALLGGRQGTQTYSLDAAKRMALQLESDERDDLDFSINILVLGKSGVGKSATINSIFGQEKVPIDAFATGTTTAKVVSGFVDGVKVQVADTPGLKSSAMEQSFNRAVLSSVKKVTNKSPPDVVLYVDRLDAQTRDLNDLPLLKTVASALGTSIWRSAVVTLTHAASAPPDGPNGTPLSYEMFITQRSHVVQQSIGHAVGDLRMMSPSLMNPVSLVENHPSCRKNREGQKILPNGQSWRPQLLLLCYSMKILSEANSFSKPQDPFDQRKLFGLRVRSPPLPYMLSSMLQSRPHPKLPSDQGGENADSDIDLDDLSDSGEEEEDEYDQLPPFKPLKKAQIAKLSAEQRKAYFEEYDYRVKLLQKKQWREELRRMKEMKKKGKDTATDYGFAEDDVDSGAAAPVAVPLPDMALPPSFDGDNPAYRYRLLEPTSQFLARPVLDSHGWDHDSGYDGVNLEHSLALASCFPVAYTVQITKDKKDFSISLDSSISAKHGENMSSMAGFDIQSMGKQLAYIIRGETKMKNWKKNKAAAGMSLTFLGENVVPGVKVEDQVTLGKQYVLVGSAGAVRSRHDTAYGANLELQRRELDYPIGQVQSTLSMSIIKWRGDLALGLNSLAQFSIGRNSKVAVRAGINNKLSGQVTVKTSSSEHLSLALAAILPTAISIYKKLLPSTGEKYSIY